MVIAAAANAAWLQYYALTPDTPPPPPNQIEAPPARFASADPGRARVVEGQPREPVDVETVDPFAGRSAREGARGLGHLETPRGEPPEDLRHVDFGPPSAGVTRVALVQHQNPHGHAPSVASRYAGPEALRAAGPARSSLPPPGPAKL